MFAETQESYVCTVSRRRPFICVTVSVTQITTKATVPGFPVWCLQESRHDGWIPLNMLMEGLPFAEDEALRAIASMTGRPLAVDSLPRPTKVRRLISNKEEVSMHFHWLNVHGTCAESPCHGTCATAFRGLQDPLVPFSLVPYLSWVDFFCTIGSRCMPETRRRSLQTYQVFCCGCSHQHC